MSDDSCPHCGRDLSPAEVQGGRCYECGHRPNAAQETAIQQHPIAPPGLGRRWRALGRTALNPASADLRGWLAVRDGLAGMIAGTLLVLTSHLGFNAVAFGFGDGMKALSLQLGSVRLAAPTIFLGCLGIGVLLLGWGHYKCSAVPRDSTGAIEVTRMNTVVLLVIILPCGPGILGNLIMSWPIAHSEDAFFLLAYCTAGVVVQIACALRFLRRVAWHFGNKELDQQLLGFLVLGGIAVPSIAALSWCLNVLAEGVGDASRILILWPEVLIDLLLVPMLVWFLFLLETSRRTIAKGMIG